MKKFMVILLVLCNLLVLPPHDYNIDTLNRINPVRIEV